jgi:NADH dehydrogenase [ubiquinone] 1 alpha subcomplex assembly factor 6
MLHAYRKHDPSLHVLLPFVPRRTVSLYLSLHALCITLAQIPSITSTPQIAALRMQFWTSTVHSIFNNAQLPREPIAILLHSALSSHNPMLKTWLNRILSTYSTHVHSPPHPSLSSLEAYAESTRSTLLYILLGSLPLSSLTADHLASHIGKAVGIAAVLKNLPSMAFPGVNQNHHKAPGPGRQGLVMLPLDVMARHAVSEESVLREGPRATGLADAVFEVATRANDHLITAREMLAGLKRGEGVGHEFEGRADEHGVGGKEAEGDKAKLEEVKRAFSLLMSPAVSTGLWLKRLEKGGFDIFREDLRRGEWKLPWTAYWAWKRGKF